MTSLSNYQNFHQVSSKFGVIIKKTFAAVYIVSLNGSMGKAQSLQLSNNNDFFFNTLEVESDLYLPLYDLVY